MEFNLKEKSTALMRLEVAHENTLYERDIFATHCACFEHSNVHDPHAVAVVKGGSTVGHAPRGVARVFYFFIRHEGNIT